MEKIYAPFEEKIVKALNEFQELASPGCGEPYICPHTKDILIATKQGWVCPSCDYTQNWAHKP